MALPMTSQSESIRTIKTGRRVFTRPMPSWSAPFPSTGTHRELAASAYLPLTVSGGTFGCLVLGYGKPQPFTPENARNSSRWAE